MYDNGFEIQINSEVHACTILCRKSDFLSVAVALQTNSNKSQTVYKMTMQPTPLNVFMYPDRTVTVLHIIDNTSMSTTHLTLTHTNTHSQL